MLSVGLTGNVAAGKSAALRLFEGWGATVIDADALVREAQAPGSSVLAAIRERFGNGVIQPDGELDRAALRRTVAGDDDALAALNAIVHPVVRRQRGELLSAAEARGDLIVISEIPLLFEVLDPQTFDAVILVDAPVALRRARLCQARGFSADEADQLIASQMPAEDKRSRSRFVLDNAGSPADLEGRAWATWRTLRREGARAPVGEGGRVLACFAHPDDESFSMGGTLARYADAGVEVHVWCATAGEAGSMGRDGRGGRALGASRAKELERAAGVLGVSELHLQDFPDGGLTTDDAAGRAAVAGAISSVRPNVVVTFGPDGVTAHRDHVAVHHWVRQSSRASGLSPRLYYVTYPARLAASLPRVAGRPEEEIAAELDVRPWQDLKREAIAAHMSQRFPFDLDEAPGRRLLEREWFAREDGGRPRVHDLFEALSPA